MNSAGRQFYRFADVEVDADGGYLRRNGAEVHLRQKTFQVLVYLLEHRGTDLAKNQIISDVWKETAVVDDVLVQSIKDIRRALDDDLRKPRFIRTIPKHGYRFIGSLADEKNDALQTAASPIAVPDKHRLTSIVGSRPVLLVSLLSILLILLISVVGFQILNRNAASRSSIDLPYASGKTSLAVMFFENQSKDAELDWLREGLTDMLITDLSRTRGLSVLSRGQLNSLLERTGRTPADKLGAEDALSIVRQTNTAAVITGSFARLGDKVRLDVQLHDTKTGELTAAESLTVDKVDDILTQIDLLSLKLANRLGADSPGENVAGLASVMTNSLEAYRYYSLALQKVDALHNLDAIRLLEKATSIDPEFAMAHARIGYAYAVTGNEPEKGRRHLEKAFQLSSRLTEKDRLNIAAWYAIANTDYQNAIDQFRQIVAKYPLETEAYYRLSRLLKGEGQTEEALNVLKAGTAADPNEKNLYNGIGGILSVLGRHDEAIAAHQHYVALAPNEPNSYDSLAMTYQWAGDYASAIANYEQALRLNPDFEVAIIHSAHAHFQIGQYKQALELYQKYIDRAPSDVERGRGHWSIAFVHLQKRNLDLAEKAAKPLVKFGKEWNTILYQIEIEKGNLAKADELVETFLADHPANGRGGHNSPRPGLYYLGYFALKKGLNDEAISNFQEALRSLPQPWDIDTYEDCLANVYLDIGRFDEAITEYERILRLNPNYPLAAYHLAQAYEKSGQNAKAAENYHRFLESWKDADADIPEIIAARRFISEVGWNLTQRDSNVS